MYVIMVPVVNFWSALCYHVLRYGLKIFDGGIGLNGFLFASVTSIAIWAVTVRASNLKFGGY